MTIIRSVNFKINIIVNYIKDFLKNIQSKIKESFLWDKYYSMLREPKLKAAVPYDIKIHSKIRKKLIDCGFNIVDYRIDKSKYLSYLQKAKYNNYISYFAFNSKAGNFFEKSLEHFISAELLELNKEDIYMDIANANSPAPDIYQKLYGCKIYRQDLWYPKGIYKNIIGGNAGDMPISNNFCTKMALHCSFEHFEGKSDTLFIKEASRVLKDGGKLCIIPLYLFDRYVIQTDPSVLSKRNISFDKDAILYCAKKWRNRHGRWYDPSHFIKRIQNHMKNLKLTIFYVQNDKKIHESCYVKFIALFEKKN